MQFFNLKRRLLSFKYAAKGFKWAFSTQPNLWIHLCATVLVILLGFYFEVTKTEWYILIGCIVMVFTIEFVNTAIEWLTDSIYKEKNITAGKIKDVAAGAVLIVAVGAAVIGVMIFYPYVKGHFF
jgi:diacylglycerol kinase (ATP)